MTYKYSNDYFATVCSYADQEFDLTSNGETGSFEQAIELDEDWDLADLKAIVIIQNRDNYPIYSGQYTLQANPVIQAAKTSYTGILPMFRADITEGPASLGVQFTNLSFPQDGIESFEWDFDGDGVFDLNLEEPYYLFTEPGQYDITLRIMVEGEYSETTVENYITVTDGANISGAIAGFWSPYVGTYYIEDDVIIPEGSELAIGPGTEIVINNGSKIIAEGLIAADGALGDMIEFRTDNGWQGIEISGNQMNNVFRNCKFSGSTNTVMKIDYDSHLEICDNVFVNNSNTAASATSIDITSSDNINICRNVFANNSHSTQTGGIILTSSSPVIDNNLFVNNSGPSALAGAFIFRSGSAPVLTNNTITHNQGNNLMFIHASNPIIRNSIIQHENTLVMLITGSLTIEYSCADGGYEGVGNIDVDPMFEAPSAGSGPDYNGYSALWYLQEGSPCIDAGDPDVQYNDNEDPDNTGYALWPAMGTLTNDIGAFGGNGLEEYTNSEDEMIPDPANISSLSVFPNPFNPETNIKLQLKESDMQKPISLNIYNVRGQLVAKLIDDQIVSNDLIRWNGRDRKNRPVTSGIYFARLSTATAVVSEKLILLK